MEARRSTPAAASIMRFICVEVFLGMSAMRRVMFFFTLSTAVTAASAESRLNVRWKVVNHPDSVRAIEPSAYTFRRSPVRIDRSSPQCASTVSQSSHVAVDIGETGAQRLPSVCVVGAKRKQSHR